MTYSDHGRIFSHKQQQQQQQEQQSDHHKCVYQLMYCEASNYIIITKINFSTTYF
jgi:hypothetical protein